MSTLGLIIKREYLRRASKKSFILLTILTPFLMAALIFVPLWLASIDSDDIRSIAIIDSTGKYGELFNDTDKYRFIVSDKSIDEYKACGNREIWAFLCITDDLLNDPKAATLYSERQIPSDLERLVNSILKKQIERDKLATYNIPNLEQILKESKVRFNVSTIKWSEDGKGKRSSSIVASITGGIFTMVIYMFIMIYGAMVMQGVMEEKTNRIVEIMISSVKPFDLMMGKIIGIGLVGLTQVFLWSVMLSAIMFVAGIITGSGINDGAIQSGMAINGNTAINTNMAQAQMGYGWFETLQTINFNEIGILFVIYFIGGYLLYSSLFAAIGSAVDNQEDTQQFMVPISVLLIFGLYAGIYSMENPDGPLAFWCSIIPITSPIVMMVRVPFEVKLWEIVVSILSLYASAIAITWLSAKIYRVGILMYGKKPSIMEIIKWIRYR